MSELRRQQIGTFNLGDISDVTIGTPIVDQVLKYNGSNWIPGAQTTSSTGNGVDFYLDDTAIIPLSSENSFEVNTLTSSPVTTTEVLDATTLTNTTVLKEAYLYNTALGRTQLDSGVWWLSTYASINSTTGTGTAEVITSIKNVVVESVNTVTITGSGTSRTVTASAGTPFAAGDANADQTLCGFVRTPKGVYQITAYTSSTVVTIATPSAYVNESAVAFSVWKHAFNMTTGNITTTALSLYEPNYVEPQIVTNLTDKIAAIYFAKSTFIISKTITFSHNGTTNYSHFHTPLVTLHDSLAGLYGTSATESYGHISFGAQSIYGAKTFIDTVTVAKTGSAGVNNSLIEIKNENSLPLGTDMTNTSSSINMYQRIPGGNFEQAGRISWICESSFGTSSATQNTGLYLYVLRQGTLAAACYVDKTQNATFYGSITTAGSISTSTGAIYTSSGAIYTSNGAIYSSNGDIYTSGGDIKASNAFITTAGLAYFGAKDTVGTFRAIKSGTGNNTTITIGHYEDIGGSIYAYVSKLSFDYTGNFNIHDSGGNAYIITGADSTQKYLKINTSSSSAQTMLVLQKQGTDKWYLASRNELDAPNDRFAFICNTGSSYPELAFFLMGKKMLIVNGYDTAPTLTADGQFAIFLESGDIPRFCYRSGGTTYTKTISIS